MQLFVKYWEYLHTLTNRARKVILTDPVWLSFLIISLLALSWVVFIGLIFPANDYDGNAYHLTFIGNVMQSGNFFDVPTSLAWLNGYPKGGEFIQMWSVIITRNDFMSDLAQVPFLFLAIYSLYQTCITVGADKTHARFSAILFLFLPVVFNQLKTTYVDVMLSALLFAGLATIIKRRLGKLDLFIIGIIFTLLISIKSTGFLFVAALTPLLLWKLYMQHYSQTKNLVSSFIKPLGLVALPTFFGLYWYIKNFIAYDTPIHPFGFKLLGKSIFPGKTFQEFAADAVNQSTVLPSGDLQRIWFVWTEQRDWFGCFYNYDTNYAGLGPIWFIILIPSFLMALYFTLKKRNYLYLAISASIGFLFLAYPSNYYTRYTMFIAALGIMGLSIVMTYLKPGVTLVIRLLTILLAMFVLATNVALCNFPPKAIRSQVQALLHGSDRGIVYESLPGQAYIFLEDRVNSDEVVAYDSSPIFIYPLWKSDYSNDVLYVPASNKTSWLDGLKEKNVRYVFTNKFSKENSWAEPELESIYEDEIYEIFKVN